MSATSQDAMPLLCELGWHRPDQLARWNDGYYFSKCSRCGRDLVRTAYGSWQLPKGYRVVWQPKPPETREEIALVPSGDVEVSGAHGDRLDFPVADVKSNEPIQIEPPETEVPTAASPPVPQHLPAPEEPQPSEEPAPLAEPQEAAAPAPEIEDEPAQTAAVEPLPQLSDPAPAQKDAAGEPISAQTAEPKLAEDQLRTESPGEELLQQPNGTAHTVEQHLSIAQETPASPVEDVAPAAREGRKELPIAEVLRHLNATPLPEPPVEPQDEAKTVDDTAVVDEPGPAVAQEAGQPGGQPQDSIEQAPPGADEPVEGVSADDVADHEASAASGEPAERLDAAPEPDAAELPFEPALPPREPPSPVEDSPPGWDFMAEEEEDPIGSFWDDPAPAPITAPAGEASAEDAPEPGPEPEQAIGEALPDEQPESVAAPEQPEGSGAVSAPLPENRAEPVAPPPPVEPAEPIAAPAPPERTEPVRAATWPRWMDADADAATPHSAEAAAAVRQSEASAPAHAPIGVPPQSRAAEPSEAARKVPEPDDVPPWVDATDEEADSGGTGSRSSRFAVTAVVSIGVLALAAALAGRPGSNPIEVPQREAAPAPMAAPAPKEPVTVGRDAPAAATKMPFARREPAFVSPGKPVPMALPALPAREQAFVTASVLQCRSAPVHQSPAVRKLVRGAEVQILAHEGAWASVAHKGRQCWAAARFLSAAQPL
ncbi:MAG: SH3 domain-containing protein [Pseudomonadota bacterium]|nr:SH3 domain-containing protein [Pseudomonadota bacterium]